jgi:hypothetical protein
MGSTALYRPRRPTSSPLYRLLQDHFERLERVHDEWFRRTHGRLHAGVRKIVQRYLDCGLLENGFVRVRCPACQAYFLLAFSCKCRYLCPSCHAKRLLFWTDWLEDEILDEVPHRQFVFTLPKRLRPYLLHDRRLLGLLSRTAFVTLRDFLRASLGEGDVLPGVVASIQTFCALLNWHPHLHLLVTDGAYRPDGTFRPLLFHDPQVLTEAFRRAVLAAFVKEGLFTPETADAMLAWPHSGFHVHHRVRIEPADAKGRAHLVRYSARAPLALSRITYLPEEGRVCLRSDKADGPTAGTHSFEPLEFLARLLAHLPRKGDVYIRYYGAYSVRRRAAWRKAGIRPGTPRLVAAEPPESLPEALRARRRRWAELLRRIWDVDVESCPRCGAPMTLLAFTLDPHVIDETLRRLRQHGHDPRAGPWASVPAPATPA